MTKQDPPTDSEIVQSLIRLVQSDQESNIKLAFKLAKSQGNPTGFQHYLQTLQELYEWCKGKPIKKITPAMVTKLFQMTFLDVFGKKLSSMPENIGLLQNLTELHCSFNQLTSLPESIGLLQNLTEIDCSENQLTILPGSIGQLQSLTKIDCSNNRLTSLPESLAELPNLQEIDARGNPLESIPQALRNKPELTLLVD